MKKILYRSIAVVFLISCIIIIPHIVSILNSSPVPETTSQNIITLKAITIGTEPATGMDKFYEQLDALTIPELGCILRFTFIPWGDERNQIDIATATGEYDFISGGTFSNYQKLVYKNAFLNLNNYLYLVPDLVEHYNDDGVQLLTDCEINGGLYGIPQYVALIAEGFNDGFFFRDDLRKEWGLPEITDIDSLEAYLYRAKQEPQYKDEPLITDNRIWICLWEMLSKGNYLEVISTSVTPFIVTTWDNPYEPINRMETSEFAEVLSYIEKWYNDGIIESDMLVISDNESSRGKLLMQSDSKPCETNAPIWSCNGSYVPELLEQHPDWEFGFFGYGECNDRYYKMQTLSGCTVISISSKSAYPETAIKLLEKVHTDSRYYNLISYGVEGIHYYLEDNAISIDGIATSNLFSAWTGTSDTLMELDEVLPEEETWRVYYNALMEKVEATTEAATIHPLDGFELNISSVASYNTQIESILESYYEPMMCGVFQNREEDMALAKEKLIEAGIDEYIENVRQQIEDFRNEK